MRGVQRLLVLGCLAWPVSAGADAVILKDGTRVEGEIRRTGDGYRVTQADGTVTSIAADRVASFDVRPVGGSDAAMGRLQSLRRAADNLSDIRQIIDRFHAFIEQNPGTPAAQAAAADVKLWQERQDKGLIKVGDKWMTLAERDALRGKSIDVALALHDMLKQGRLKEAGGVLDRALQIDPQNPTLQYLRGVLTYDEEQIPLAKRAFESVNAVAPDHAPTLNNLAVVLWRQNSRTAAMGYYDRAILAAPGSRDILDNIVEALNALPKEQRDALVVKKLLRHFTQQENDLQKAMALQGKHRYGSSWLSDAEIKKVEDQEKAVNDQIAQMSQDFDADKERIAAIDTQIRQTVDEMNQIDAQTYAQGPNGQIVRLPYPQLYYTLGRQLATLRAERASRLAEMDRLRGAAKAAKEKLPPPKFTGIQKLIDADGMPLPAGFHLPGPPAPAPAPVNPLAPPATQPLAPVPVPRVGPG